MFFLSSKNSRLRETFARCRPALAWAAAFSALVNILYLTPTIYMMQVYDRVVPAASGGTLLVISLVGIGGLATLSLLDWLRGRILVRISSRFERELAGPTLNATLSRRGLSRIDRAEAIREFDTLRQTLSGSAMLAIFDAPWAPIYLVVAFLLHPLLALVAAIAAAVLIALAWANEKATHAPLTAANQAASIAYAKQAQVSSYAEEVRAIGMREALTAKALDDRYEANSRQLEASFAAGRYGAIIKFVRLVFQSAALAVGAWLAIDGKISMGSIIAASLLLSRVLSPIEQIVGAWKGLLRARAAHDHLAAILDNPEARTHTRLPELVGRIDAEQVFVRDYHGRDILTGVSFRIEPGETIGLVGLSGAGKSTLLRVLAGSLDPSQGSIRYDGAALTDWDAEQLARSIGYLPQDFALFPGTVKENISRFDRWRGVPESDIDANAIVAAKAIGAHEMILRLPAGYDTVVGQGGIGLSGGQTQRIAIARALYGAPRVMIFDEPNAHLDADATASLFDTIGRLKADGVTIVLAAHSAELLQTCTRLLVLAGGRLAERPMSAMQPMRAPIAKKA